MGKHILGKICVSLILTATPLRPSCILDYFNFSDLIKRMADSGENEQKFLEKTHLPNESSSRMLS